MAGAGADAEMHPVFRDGPCPAWGGFGPVSALAGMPPGRFPRLASRAGRGYEVVGVLRRHSQIASGTKLR